MRGSLPLSLLLLTILLVSGAACRAEESRAAQPDPAPGGERATNPPGEADKSHPPSKYLFIQRKIVAGQATLAEVRLALTDEDIGALTNTVHGLYSMRWHRGVFNLIHDMWALKKDNAPEINWTQIEKSPVRLALASTLIRVEPFKNDDCVEYLREHRHDEHEFHRAQVVIGLGFKAAVEDVDYIYEMADGNNPFVAQSAITALAIMDIAPARDALIRLLKKWGTDPRGTIIEDVLRQAYHWPPSEQPPPEDKKAAPAAPPAAAN